MSIKRTANLTMNTRGQGTPCAQPPTQPDPATWPGPGYLLVTSCLTLLLLGCGLMVDSRTGLAADKGAQQPSPCIPMLEDFCPGQPLTTPASKRRTLTYL
jgi:hypothetical protein